MFLIVGSGNLGPAVAGPAEPVPTPLFHLTKHVLLCIKACTRYKSFTQQIIFSTVYRFDLQ